MADELQALLDRITEDGVQKAETRRAEILSQAKAEAAIAETRVEEAREKISLQVSQNQQKLQEAQQRLATALRSQEQADENLRMANLGMKEGVIPVSNVLQAQTAWLSAHSTLVEAEIDMRLADLYMLRALGTLR